MNYLYIDCYQGLQIHELWVRRISRFSDKYSCSTIIYAVIIIHKSTLINPRLNFNEMKSNSKFLVSTDLRSFFRFNSSEIHQINMYRRQQIQIEFPSFSGNFISNLFLLSNWTITCVCVLQSFGLKTLVIYESVILFSSVQFRFNFVVSENVLRKNVQILRINCWE